MKNHGNNLPAQTFSEMVEDGTERRKTSKLYKAESAAFVDEQLSALVKKTAEELAEVAISKPISLRAIDEVKQRTILYLRACEETSTIPSVMGLARSMGLTRQALYDCIWRGEPKDTAKWLEVCRDAFSDLLAQAGLRNACNGITAIFLEKALYGLRETTEIIAKREDSNVLGEMLTAEEIAEKYKDLPED